MGHLVCYHHQGYCPLQILAIMKLLLVAVALAALVDQGTSKGLDCYTCSTHDIPNPFLPFDPNCSDPNYSDDAFLDNWFMTDCSHITVHGSSVIGDGAVWNNEDGEGIVGDNKVFLQPHHINEIKLSIVSILFVHNKYYS